jgi:bifunctional UDP-N-acetylglucosamine pyrophosphorylase / glucosamine-1-phosphate N-acetyltransferase
VSCSVIVLAAGRGKRMCSNLPKVLHLLAGKPILKHVLDNTQKISPIKTVVVYGHAGEEIKEACKEYSITWVLQQQQLGTADAVSCALPEIDASQRVLILSGDVPLIQAETLKRFLQEVPKDSMGILTTVLDDPSGLGRIIRDKNNNLIKIIEEKDATAEIIKIKEINAGIYLIPQKYLAAWLPQITNNNQQQEYYLPDCVQLATKAQCKIFSQQIAQSWECYGINTLVQLSRLERIFQKNVAEKLMLQGVSIADPNRIDLRGNDVSISSDVCIDINCIIEGRTKINSNVTIGPNVYIKNSIIEQGAVILANSVIEGAIIGENCQVGPFARIRPQTKIAAGSKVGNFVETKNITLGARSKASHLSYLGDANIGKDVNIGAGTITCNYDGVKKHQTVIEDDVFIGSDTQLIAPILVGKGALIAAGTTLLEDAPPGKLTVTEKKQKTKDKR